MKVSVACDHGAFDLKESLKAYLTDKGYEVDDCGTYSKDSCDYPVFARKAAEKVSNGECEKGIVLCTTGIGVSMVANKVKGVRAALCHNEDCATLTRLHNNANVLAMGAKFVDDALAKKIADIFLETAFSGDERHQRRVDMIEQ